MCGIAGLVTSGQVSISSDRLGQLSHSIAHRGPDGLGFLSWSPAAGVRASEQPQSLDRAAVVLLHRRLAILDLTAAAAQPMTDADIRYCITFNGEIYNYLELKSELIGCGHCFQSSSDTEVLLTAFAQWGLAALPRLTGMFAFAIWDAYAHKLFLVRDPFGIKPLYYSVYDGHFVFASEISALLKFRGQRPKINPQSAYYYLHNGHTDHTSETLYKDIHQVPPGHYLTVSFEQPHQYQIERYWSLDLQTSLDISFSEATQYLREQFLQNIQLHMRSDVPVGAALSGGIDSSAIVAAIHHQGLAPQLHAFSYIPNDPSLSEESWVNLVGQHTDTTIHKVTASPTELVDDLDTMIARQGEPFASTSIYAQYRVFQKAREIGIKVMLDGQGADELLGGYRPYLAARLASLLARGEFGQALGFLQRASQLSNSGKKYLMTRALGLLLPSWLEEPAKLLVGRQASLPWLNKQWLDRWDIQPLPSRLNRSSSVLWEQLHRALSVTSLPMLLRYEDRNSMAHSIESRVPFLTPDLAQFVFSLPEEFIINSDGTSKHIFREAMRGIVPDTILDRRDKVGFATPEQAWIQQLRPWFETVLTSETAYQMPMFNLPRIHQEFDAIMAGKQAFDFRIWRWANLIRWAEYFEISFES